MTGPHNEPTAGAASNHPCFLYGTAWKEDRTQRLTELALQQGFRGIDTANQRRHYFEEAVGQAIAASIRQGVVTREDLFLQTKFTSMGGQDHRLPYDPAAPVTLQVHQSFAVSLEHLQTTYVDSLVLHGPTRRIGLSADDRDAWNAMQEIYEQGDARHLGVSNVSFDQLQTLCQQARVRPHFVQNRCYASQGWDQRVRALCRVNGITYQGFSLLTGNQDVLALPELARIASRYGRTVAQIIFRFAIEVGMLPLTGTSDPAHMREDLAAFDFQLEIDEVQRIELIGVR